ncbi:SusC/RagA family TonB-linked outer membrane protein [Flavihumibacter profundi]|uniref:SusC/RagA family TonB-linked outer membrane protein n=1 Tax=Flavihumibacter profundi TaxID=2716883 RepID=UPI001CC59198|nr:SusC/RagA family TonB-linked outer membrane protein [Flavihumibacter profundi]MBZ5858884.1 SusC/RagA family TonB-linked outer membrane protein [Flavihumibacter profundi]
MIKLTTRVLLVVLLCSWTTLAISQQKRVTGNVKDSKGAPVAGASVLEKGTKNGSSTDESGNFSISVSGNNAILVISSVNFTNQEIKVGASNMLSVTLQPLDASLGEVVVTALGISKQKRQLGYSVTEVKGSELAKTNEVNPINALQGKVAGVQIDQGAGGLFGNTKILIRGNSTLGTNNQPIFVIDGVIMDNDVFSGTGRDFGNDLKNLNMEDFETVSILKGSSAAALYGTRAINGVVLITTKKGVQRKGIGVTVNQSYNITDPYAGPQFQNEFGGGTVGAFFTDSREPNYKPNENWYTKVFPIDPITGKEYIDRQINRELENWGPRLNGQEVQNYDGTMTKYVAQPNNFLDAYQQGYGSNTNVALEGGTDRSTFRLSVNHNQGEGIYMNNTMVKNAFDLRVTHQVTKAISIDVSSSYSNLVGKNPPRLGGLDAFGSFNIGHMYTWVLPRNYDTKYWMQPEHYTSVLGGAPDPANPDEPNKAPETRFWYSLFNNNYTQNEQLLRSRVAITTQLSSWAKLVLEGNINNIYRKSESKELGQLPNFAGGYYGLGFNTKESQFAKWMLMMNKDINKDLSVSGYIGGEMQNYKTTYSSSETSGGLNYPGNYFISNSVNPPLTNGGIQTKKRFNSLYASADLAYKNQLFLQATWRGDWSSALTYSDGTGNNFYNYPAVSASWIFTETFHLPSFISFGKLRANIAALGGDTDPFTVNPGYALNGFSYANGGTVPTSTYTSSQVLQPNIKPLRKVSKEIGVDMRFLKNRVGFALSLYQDNTKNQILPITAPVESGVSSILINAGEIQNKGIEIAIDGTPISSKDFSWNTAFNISRNRNMIVDLYPGRTEYNLGADIAEISTWAVVGKSYGTLRTTIHSQPYQATDANGNKVEDPRNGLPVLSWRGDARAAFPKRSNYLQDVGDINAKYRWGWDNTFRYKSFSLNILIDAKVGGDFVLASYRFGTHTGVFPNTLHGRDAEHGGITWTSKYDGQTYDDGIIVDGVFPAGQKITQPDGSQADVGGLTFKEAYDKGLVEPTHLPQFGYRYGSSSTGVADYWVVKSSWIALRQVALSYSFKKELYTKLKLNGLSLSVAGRDIAFLQNSLPYNFNPASNNSNNTAFSGENGFLPMVRNIMFTLRASF